MNMLLVYRYVLSYECLCVFVYIAVAVVLIVVVVLLILVVVVVAIVVMVIRFSFSCLSSIYQTYSSVWLNLHWCNPCAHHVHAVNTVNHIGYHANFYTDHILQ